MKKTEPPRQICKPNKGGSHVVKPDKVKSDAVTRDTKKSFTGRD